MGAPRVGSFLRIGFGLLLLCFCLLVGGVAPGVAQPNTVVFGSDLSEPPMSVDAGCGSDGLDNGQACTVVAGGYQTGNAYPLEAPVSGTITQITIKTNTPDTFTPRIVVPGPSGLPSITAIETGPTLHAAGTGAPESFTVSMPVQAGDLLAGDGTSTSAVACDGGVDYTYSPPVANGATASPTATIQGCHFLANATIQTNDSYTLSVFKAGSSGSGSVISADGSINCGQSCSWTYPSGTQVTLTATPASGSNFAGWSGGGCSGTGNCSVTMNSAQSVTATFNVVGHPETAGGLAHTWTNYLNAGGTQGPSIQGGQTVQIACKVQGFRVADGNTWWYKIASSPWNGNYYVSADAFYNNGHTSGSLRGTPFVDNSVPNCTSSPPPPPARPPHTYPVMNATGGIYWRSGPDWNTAVRIAGNGFYPGTWVTVICYRLGAGNVPGSANRMWEQARWYSGSGSGSGWINEHFIDDGVGINQHSPNVPACSGGSAPIEDPLPGGSSSSPPVAPQSLTGLMGGPETRRVSVINLSDVPQSQVAAFENAAKTMINGDFHSAWGRSYIQFGSGSPTRLLLFNDYDKKHNYPLISQYCGKGANGCHTWDEKRNSPEAYVAVNLGAFGWQYTASHELEEMFVDPAGNLNRPLAKRPGWEWNVEVSDPVAGWYRSINGVHIADFVYPAWYYNVPGRQDELGPGITGLPYGGTGSYCGSPNGYEGIQNTDGTGTHAVAVRC